jgi:uncharacterized BrkB/YihY/UPF0761 family membrane protein
VLVLQALFAQILAYAFIFLMFVLIYRYLPARRSPGGSRFRRSYLYRGGVSRS